MSWVSLKLASMKTSLSGTTLASRCPAWMKSPVLTMRLENVPSTGARTEVKARSRSALASWVCNSASCARASACCAFVTSTLSRAASKAACADLTAARLWSRPASDTSKAAREAKPLVLSVCWRSKSRPARFSAASAEASCALACSAALSSAVTWRPMRSIVACWVAILLRAAIHRDAIVAVIDPEDHLAGANDRIVARAGSPRHGPTPGRRAWCCWRGHRRCRSRHRSVRSRTK